MLKKIFSKISSRLRELFGGRRRVAEIVQAPALTEVGLRPTIDYVSPDPAMDRGKNVEGGSAKTNSVEAYKWLADQFTKSFADAVASSPLRKLCDGIKAATNSGAAIAAAYGERMKTLAAEFTDTIHPHIKNVAEKNRRLKETGVGIRKLIGKHQRELQDSEFRLTGEPDRSVPAVNWFQTAAVATLVFVFVTGLETGLTAGIIGYYSDLQTAQLMGLAIASMLTILGTVWGVCSRIVSSAEDTTKRHWQFLGRKNIGVEDFRYRQLTVWQPERMIHDLYRGSRVAYVLVAGSWFTVRLFAVVANPTSDNGVGLLVAGMVSVLGYVGKMLISIFAPPYGLEHFKLDHLRKEVDQLEKELASLSTRSASIPEVITQAGQRFGGLADIAWRELVLAPIASVRQAIINALHVADRLNDLRQSTSKEFVLEAANICGNIEGSKAKEAGKKGEVRVTINKAEILAHLKLPPEDEFLGMLREGINLEMLLPGQIPAEPNRIVAELLAAESEAEKQQLEEDIEPTRVTVVFEGGKL